MHPSTATAHFRSNQNDIAVKICTSIPKNHILSRQEHKHMSKVQGHCATAKEEIKQQSFSFEKCCSSSHCRNRPQSLVRLIRRKGADFMWNQRSSLKQIKVTGKKPREPTTHISLQENNTPEWKWALTWTCYHTPPILNIQTPRTISYRYGFPHNHLEYWKCGNIISLCLCEKVKLNKKLTPFSSKIIILSAQRMWKHFSWQELHYIYTWGTHRQDY